MIPALTRRLHLAAAKRQAARNEAWLMDLDDQIKSGQYALARALERRDTLRARILALESPGRLIAEAIDRALIGEVPCL